MDYSIRTALPKDAKALLEIYDYYVRETAITFEYETPSVEEFQGRIEKTLEKFPYLVIEQDGRILGYAYASAFHERAAYQWCAEMSIYLHKDARGKGLGTLLYDELEKRLVDQGFLNLYACIAYPDSEDSHLTLGSVKFHENRGYSLIGKFSKCGFKFDTWYNMVWMEKIIGEHTDKPKELWE